MRTYALFVEKIMTVFLESETDKLLRGHLEVL